MTDAHTCDTCVHWTKNTGVTDAGLLGDCDCPKFLKGYHHDDKEAMPDGVRVEDDEGWGFATGPKFGCIHWKAKA